MLRTNEHGLQEARQAQLLRHCNGAIRSFKLALCRLEGGYGFRHIHFFKIAELKRQACADAFVERRHALQPRLGQAKRAPLKGQGVYGGLKPFADRCDKGRVVIA